MDLHVDGGTLLAAGPDMLDPNFMHTIVLVCQHSDEGAYGLVVNRPSEHSTRQVLGEHPRLGQIDLPIHIGGPVGMETMQILHRVPDRIPGGLDLGSGVWIGGDLDAVADFAAASGDPSRDLRLFVGYSGWGAGQLEMELATGSWLPAPGEVERVFHADAERVWRDVVRSVDSGGEDLGLQPPDPGWN